MRPRRQAVPLALLLVLGAACAAPDQTTPPAGASASARTSPSALPSEQSPTGAPTPTVTPTPALPTSSDATFSLLPAAGPPGHTPTISCSGDIGPSDPVAIVQLKGTRQTFGPRVMRDYSDPANPRTVCEFGDESVEQLVDARHVVVSNCDGSECLLAVVDLPEVVYHWFVLPRPDDAGANFIAVSPNLDEVAWSSLEGQGYTDQVRRLHLTRQDGDHVVARFLPVDGRCGSPDDSKAGAYTRSGEHMYALDVPWGGDTVFVGFHGLDRVFRIRPPYDDVHGAPAMPVWSPTAEVLYYRRAGSVWKWTPAGGEELFLPDTLWRYPTISPDGRYLAYAQPKDNGNHEVYLIDLQSGGGPKLIGQDRKTPAFITATQLWWRSEITDHGCAGGETSPLIYDINEGAESRSIIEFVQAVWPATSANY